MEQLLFFKQYRRIEECWLTGLSAVPERRKLLYPLQSGRGGWILPLPPWISLQNPLLS